MANLKRIVDVCTELDIDLNSVHLFAGHKEILFALPDEVLESLRDAEGYLGDKYDKFCADNGIYYLGEEDLWVA